MVLELVQKNCIKAPLGLMGNVHCYSNSSGNITGMMIRGNKIWEIRYRDMMGLSW